jgi:hypothetical protein
MNIRYVKISKKEFKLLLTNNELMTQLIKARKKKITLEEMINEVKKENKI